MTDKETCAGYIGHLFAQTVLERQGVVVVVRQALFERMALVASTRPSGGPPGSLDVDGYLLPPLHLTHGPGDSAVPGSAPVELGEDDQHTLAGGFLVE
jgi:hypothetical protein